MNFYHLDNVLHVQFEHSQRDAGVAARLFGFLMNQSIILSINKQPNLIFIHNLLGGGNYS